MKVTATADFRDIASLAGLAPRAEGAVVSSATRKAEALVKAEAPGGAGGRIGRGVVSALDLRGRPARGEVEVEALAPRDAGTGTLHTSKGATRQVSLRGGAAVNVAQLVAEGTGLYGMRGKVIKPHRGRVLLIGVESVPAGESYITAAGGKFIMRPRSSGMRPDDYPGRAADRLEGELEGLVYAALGQLGL